MLMALALQLLLHGIGRDGIGRLGLAADYSCDDGREVSLGFSGPDTAWLRTDDGAIHQLTIARSASGARYVGDGWQWWGKGLDEGTLAPLAPGEDVASDPGARCRRTD